MPIAAYQGPVVFRDWEANLVAAIDVIMKAGEAGALR